MRTTFPSSRIAATVLKVLFAFIANLLLALPAAAADGTELVFIPWFLLAAVSVLASLSVLRLLRLQREKSELSARLRLAELIVEQTPLAILDLDDDGRVLAANQMARMAWKDSRLLGLHLTDLRSELAGQPLPGNLQQSQGPTIIAPGQAAHNQLTFDCGDLLSLTETTGRTRAVWFDRPKPEKLFDEDVASLAEESASRMKSEFIANINHEVRTPMNAIIGYTEMLANAPLGPKEKRFVGIIHKSSMALVSIFNDIMELSKIDSGRIQIMASTVRLQAIINEVMGLFKDLAEEKGIELTSRIDPDLPVSVICDGVRLKQILQNLVGNAIKFTHEGAVTLIADGVVSAGKPGCVDLRFVVEDTGIGIPEVDQEKIFELFRQREDVITKQYGGVGLGLTLCSRLAAMMGGRIDLVSEVGKGTRFTVLLDRIQMATSAVVEPATGAPIEAGERKLLVVDDVDLIKDVFVDYFQDTPYRILTAASGDEALTVARSERPDLIFMDLNLTGRDGRSVTAELRRTPEIADIPVVVMTGEMLEENDYHPLFNDFLQKPFRLEALKDIIVRHMRPAAEPGEQVAAEGDEPLAGLLAPAWTEDLETLRRQAVFSGSLADAASLALAMQEQGVASNHPNLTILGEELLLHAQEPNILGVDRLMARLARISPRIAP